MKCFNHEKLEAVATCQSCGKGLCKTCAAKYTPCLCDECFNAINQKNMQRKQAEENDRRQRHINALVDTKREFIVTCIQGIIILAVCFYLLGYDGKIIESDVKLLACTFFFIPFGWKLLTYSSSFIFTNVIATPSYWTIYFVIHIVFSYFVGFTAFAYQLYKTIKNEQELKRIS